MGMARKHMKRCSTSLSEKCKSKLHTDINTHQSEWSSSKFTNNRDFPAGSVVKNPPYSANRDQTCIKHLGCVFDPWLGWRATMPPRHNYWAHHHSQSLCTAAEDPECSHWDCKQSKEHFCKFTNNKCWRQFGERGALLHSWWECKLIQSSWRTVFKFLKKLKIELPVLTWATHILKLERYRDRD